MTEYPTPGPGAATSPSRPVVSKVGMCAHTRATHRLILRGMERILETLFDMVISFLNCISIFSHAHNTVVHANNL